MKESLLHFMVSFDDGLYISQKSKI